MSGEYPVVRLCESFAVSKSGYYDWCKAADSQRAQQDRVFAEQIKVVHARSRGTYGSPRITHELKTKGVTVGHNRVARLMREEGVVGRHRCRYRVMTTDSRHNHPIAPNHLAQIKVSRPNQAWVSDITYVHTEEGWLYVAGIMDCFSKAIVGWAMESFIDTKLTLGALEMAIQHRQPGPGLLLHSDRGVQYASEAYRAALTKHALVPSMSRKANCYDNAAMESFWSTLKNELIHRTRFATRLEAKRAIFDYIEVFYNRQRLHSSIGYNSPLDYESNLN